MNVFYDEKMFISYKYKGIMKWYKMRKLRKKIHKYFKNLRENYDATNIQNNISALYNIYFQLNYNGCKSDIRIDPKNISNDSLVISYDETINYGGKMAVYHIKMKFFFSGYKNKSVSCNMYSDIANDYHFSIWQSYNNDSPNEREIERIAVITLIDNMERSLLNLINLENYD